MNYNKNSKMRFRLWQHRGFWAVVSSLVALCLVVGGALGAPPVQAEPMLLAAVVDIAVVPSSVTVRPDAIFTLDIYVYPNGQQVDAVDAAMAFDPTYLEVLSITGDPSGLDQPLYSAFDNTAGTLTHSQGKFSAPFPTTDFRLCSIEFKAKAATAGTILAFTGAGATGAYFGGSSVLRNTTNGTIEISVTAPVGGVGYLADPAQILAPWVGLIAMTGLILVAVVRFLKKAHRGV